MDLLVATNSVNLAGADGPPVGGVAQYGTDGNPALNIPPTRWPSYWLNSLMQELKAILTDGGVAPDRTVLTQLRDAIRAMIATSSSSYLADTGATNAMVITPAPALGAYVGGKTFRIVPGHSNTGAVTLNVSGLGAKAVVRPDLEALAVGDIPASGLIEVTYQAALDKFVLMTTTTNFQSVSTTGFARIPGTNLIIQWTGYSLTPNQTTNCPTGSTWGQQTITWPIAFPNTCVTAWLGPQVTTNGQYCFGMMGSINAANGIAFVNTWNTATFPIFGLAIAIGY